MLRQIKAIRCTHVAAQVSLGYYDAEGNLVGEEAFPQNAGSLVVARLFHPHPEQLASLIETCVEQAWAKVAAQEAGGGAPPDAGEAGPGRPGWDEDARESPPVKERK